MVRAASDAQGMEVLVGGRLGSSFFPDLPVRLDDVQILKRGMDIASAKEADLESALLPLRSITSLFCACRQAMAQRVSPSTASRKGI